MMTMTIIVMTRCWLVTTCSWSPWSPQTWPETRGWACLCWRGSTTSTPRTGPPRSCCVRTTGDDSDNDSDDSDDDAGVTRTSWPSPRRCSTARSWWLAASSPGTLSGSPSPSSLPGARISRWTLASDWSRLVTRSEYWPLIGLCIFISGFWLISGPCEHLLLQQLRGGGDRGQVSSYFPNVASLSNIWQSVTQLAYLEQRCQEMVLMGSIMFSDWL